MLPAAASSPSPACELCRQAGGELVLRREDWRLIRVPDADFPAFYRVVWNAHVAEMSDLGEAEQQSLWSAVNMVERVLRVQLSPAKINLASLGNMVPHLHWHVIARFDWDSHFPQPVWGQRQREVAGAASRLPCTLAALDEAMRTAFAA